LSDRRNITLRLDRVWDSTRLHELARRCGLRLSAGAFIVAEVGGQVIAALPLGEGPPLADDTPGTSEVLPLLAQARGDFFQPRQRWTAYVRKRTG
jgi:hypothetical protein